MKYSCTRFLKSTSLHVRPMMLTTRAAVFSGTDPSDAFRGSRSGGMLLSDFGPDECVMLIRHTIFVPPRRLCPVPIAMLDFEHRIVSDLLDGRNAARKLAGAETGTDREFRHPSTCRSGIQEFRHEWHEV